MKAKHWFVFILLGAIWSSSFLWIKIAVAEIGPVTLVAFRVLFGLLFAGGAVLAQRVEWPRDRKTWTIFIIIGLTNIAIPFFLISWGERAIDSAVAAILNSTVPLFTLVIAHLFLRDDKMTVQKVLGLLVGFAGVVILMSEDMHASQSSLLGQGAVILASLFYAGSAVYTRRNTPNAHGLVRGAAPLLPATLVMWLAAPITERPFKVPHLPITWIALLWLGVLGSGLALILNYYLIHEIGPTRATMVTYVFPLGGVILGVLFLNEHLSWQLLAGGLLIISSLVVVNWKKQ